MHHESITKTAAAFSVCIVAGILLVPVFFTVAKFILQLIFAPNFTI